MYVPISEQQFNSSIFGISKRLTWLTIHLNSLSYSALLMASLQAGRSHKIMFPIAVPSALRLDKCFFIISRLPTAATVIVNREISDSTSMPNNSYNIQYILVWFFSYIGLTAALLTGEEFSLIHENSFSSSPMLMLPMWSIADRHSNMLFCSCKDYIWRSQLF